MTRMKKTTRNYLWILVANVLLLGAVMTLWQFRLHVGPSPASQKTGTLVRQGLFESMTVADKPQPLKSALYLANLTDYADLSDLKGQWTVLNLWATWCPPCVNELPSLQKLADAYQGKGLRVLAVSIDSSTDVAALQEQMQRHKLDKLSVARNWDDKAEVTTALWPEGLPVTYLIDPQGRVVASMMGDADWMSPDARALIDSVLGR